jgi:hypothetical protein
MNPVSNIASAADVALEHRREDIRDRRWRRRRDKIRTAVWVLAICCAALGLPHLLPIPNSPGLIGDRSPQSISTSDRTRDTAWGTFRVLGQATDLVTHKAIAGAGFEPATFGL